MNRLLAARQALQIELAPIVAIGFCYLAITMMWTLYSAYVPVFLVLDYDLSAAAIGFVMMLDNLAALAIQPWIGARSDRLQSPLGRRLPLVLAATPFAAVTFALIPSVSQLVEGLLAFFVVLCIMLVAMAVIRVPLFALMPDVTPPAARATANGLINLLGGLGTLIAALALGGVYRSNRAGPFWVAGGTLFAAALILLLVILRRGPQPLGEQGESSDHESDRPTGNVLIMLRDVLATDWRTVPLLLLAILFYTFGVNAIETFFSLYGLTVLGLREEQALVLLGFFFIGYMVASVPAGVVGGRYHRRPAMLAGLAILSAMLGAVFVTESVPVVRALMPVGGLAWALVNSNALPAVVDTAPSAHAGSAIGLFYAAATLASILSPLANGWLVDRAGGDYSLIVLTACVFVGLGTVCLLLMRREEEPAVRA